MYMTLTAYFRFIGFFTDAYFLKMIKNKPLSVSCDTESGFSYLKYDKLLDLDCSTSSFELSLDFFSVSLRSAFLNVLRKSFNKFL